MKPKLAISLFSGAGIGNAGFAAAGFDFLLVNELLAERSALLALNFPGARVVTGDVWAALDEIVAQTHDALRQTHSNELFLLLATPPCQGMSANGLGTLLNNARKGLRPKLDPRNRLIIPALRCAQALRPRWIVFENVVAMKHTVIEDEDGQLVKIIDLIPRYLGSEYEGARYEVEFADYGLPQRRQRLISVYTRDREAIARFRSGASLIPAPTHGPKGSGRRPWVTVSEAIGDFPPLDGRKKETASSDAQPFHQVPVLDPKKYEWIRHTPPGASAFDNQCIKDGCRYQGNPTHGATRGQDGINRANADTPLYCVRCGSLLPRPFVREADGTLRIMSGYTSAYKRMPWDKPASTLTRNLSYPSSDHTLHPSQNRVLSIAEALKLQSISEYDYRWGPIEVRGKQYAVAPDTLISDCIGESVPPLFIQLLGWHVAYLSAGSATHPNPLPDGEREFRPLLPDGEREKGWG